MNVYYDVEDNQYRTYPDGDIATIDQMRELVENKNVSIVKLQQENKQLKDNWNKLREYFNERIEVCDNRLSSPFCDFEKTTKERLIFSQCLEKLEELEQGSDSNE